MDLVLKQICFHDVLGVLTIVMKTKTSTVVANKRPLLVSKNAEKNLKTNSVNNLFRFHRNFSLRKGAELGNDSNYR